MKSKKMKIAVAVVALFIILAAGIIPMLTKINTNQNRDNPAATAGEAKSADKGSLTLYVLQISGKDDKMIKSLITTYHKQYPHVKIKKVGFDIDNGGDQKYNQRLLNDTLAGDGPDVLLLDPSYQDTYKLEKSGVLENLTPYLTKDALFDKSKLNMTVVNKGKYNNKQLLLPVNYEVNGYIASKELLSKYGLNLPNDNKLDGFVKSISPYMSLCDGKKKSLFAFPITISDFLASSGTQFVDYDNKKTYFDTPEFKKVMECYKRIYKATPKESDFDSVDGLEGLEAFSKGTTLFSKDDNFMDFPDDLLCSESVLKDTLGMTQIIKNMPTYNGGNKTIATVDYCYAMNSASKNKIGAYNFIRNALTQQYQDSSAAKGGFPILKSAALSVKNNYLKNVIGKSDYYLHKKVVYKTLSKNMESYYDNATNNVSRCIIENGSIEKILNDSMKAYLEDRESFGSALKSLDNKVMLYLSE